MTNSLPCHQTLVYININKHQYVSRHVSSTRNPTDTKHNISPAPSAPPRNVVLYKDEKSNSVHVRWTPPDDHHSNGDITGYDVSEDLDGNLPNKLEKQNWMCSRSPTYLKS